MAEPLRFSPEELDRIEDALEDLEGVHALEDPSPQVRGVLASYRDLLVASRDALPMAEVPSGVLAAVLAEAHASATPEVATAPATDKETRPGFFARLRKSFLVPSLALAGSAALVLWISRPQDNVDAIDRPMGTAPTPTAATESRVAPPASETPSPVDGVLEHDAEPEAQPEADEEPTSTRPVAPGLAAPSAAADATVTADPADPGETPEPAVIGGASSGRFGGATQTVEEKKADAKKPGDTEPEWDLVLRADRARQTGDCAAARSDYMIATEDDDAQVRARAYAGLGLCNIQAGDDAGAEDAFARAQGIDPRVQSFIDAEREPGGEYQAKARKAAKSKPKAKPAATKKAKANAAPNAEVDQTVDPFAP